MLSEAEKQEIAEAVRHAEYPRMAIPEALKIVQAHRGWVSDESIADIAAALGMTAEEIDSVATFYEKIFRRQVGRHVIFLCDSVSCWIVDFNPIREHLSNRLGITLGQTTADGRFTLLPTVCLGACDHAPVMMIDQELFGDLTPEKVDQVLEKYP